MVQVVFEPPAFDYDNDGTDESPKFVFTDNLRLGFRTRTGYLLGGSGSTVIDVLTDIYEDLTGNEAQADGRRQGFYLDLGSGSHVVSVEAQVVKGSSNQWGTGDGDPVTDATGAHPVDQIQLLDRVIQLAEIDSRNPATLSVGRYSANGPYPPLDVVPEEPDTSFDTEQESSTATVDINFVEAFAVEDSTDAEKQDPR